MIPLAANSSKACRQSTNNTLHNQEERTTMRNRVRAYSTFALLVVFALLFAACTAPVAPAAPSTSGEAAPAESAAPAAAFKIGLVTDVGRVNDRSFNQSAWEGVKQAGEAAGLVEGEGFKYIETQDTKDYADNIQQFIDAGFNVIVTVGFAMGEATITAAKANPDVYFIGVDQFQSEALPNVTGLVFNEDKAGFLAGALAAGLNKTGTIAAVLGTDLVPPVVAFREGYVNGAKYVNPDINVISTYHPGEISQAFVDPEWGAATAKQALDQGADVVFGAGGQTGNGALQEVAAAEGAGSSLFCIGVDTDQWETLPAAHPCLVSSAIKLITPSIVELVGAYGADGAMTSGNYFGGAGLAPFHDFESVVPQELKDKLAEIDAALADGSLTTGYAP
jgi:basic membrane protein A